MLGGFCEARNSNNLTLLTKHVHLRVFIILFFLLNNLDMVSSKERGFDTFLKMCSVVKGTKR